MYNVRLYQSTGFNAYNIPDTPGLLDTCAFADVPAIDTLQQRFLTSIRVRASWSAVQNCDYVRVSDVTGAWYYTVDDVIMTSGDVALLHISPDFLLSAGGASTLTYTDGITERVHVPISNDVYGAYIEEDPLTAPAMPMDLRTVYLTDPTHDGQIFDTVTLVESTINLSATATGQDAITYTDSITGETVTVPQASKLTDRTNHEFGGRMGTGTWSLTGFLTAQTWEAISKIRSMGMEGAIVACYSLPRDYISEDVTSGNSMLDTLTGVRFTTDTEIAYQTQTALNMRALYGEYTKYGILTAAGNRCEYRAEDIFHDGDMSPKVRCIPDVRSGGKPYYRYEYFLGESGDDTFWRNCVAGAEWQNTPLVYTEKSGNALDRLQFQTERKQAVRIFELEQSQRHYESLAATMQSIGQNAFTGAQTGGAQGAAIGAVAGLIGGVASEQQYQKQYDLARTVFGMQRQAAYTQYMISQTVQPDIQFPYGADIIRDAKGNGVWCYRYIYKDTDLARVDKLLSMYGYKHTKALEKTDFTNRKKYNYVQAGGVSVSTNAAGRLPKWWSDGIANQLLYGVRVWHTIPDVTAYTDGSNT